MSDRSERIAGSLVSQAIGADAVALPRGHAMDFRLDWPDGRRGFLEVTLVTHPAAIGWQNQLAEEGGAWPVPGKWELRLSHLAMTYRPARAATLKAVELCDMFGARSTDELPEHVRYRESAIRLVEQMGELRRVRVGRDGVAVFVPARADWPDEQDPDFATVLAEWAQLGHVADHIDKTRESSVDSHLFLVPLDDVLPSRFFTDDFGPPSRLPKDYAGLAGLWVWSNFWHRFLGWDGARWHWYDWS